MAYRAYQPERRRRWRRWLLITLTLVVVVAGIAFLVSRETEQRGTVEFFAAADEASSLHRQASDIFTDTLSQIGPLLTRPEVTRRLATVVETAGQANDQLAVDIPTRVANAYGNISAASASWLRGVTEAQRVIVGIMDGEIVEGAEVALQAAIDTLRIGDVGYEQFRSAVAALPADLDAPAYGPLAYAAPDPDDPSLFDAQNLVLRIQAAYNLTPRVDLAVVGMTEPAPTGDRGGIPLVPFSDTIAINAVVSNVGNEDATAIAVRLEILDVDNGGTIVRDQSIDSLLAGASTSVSFADLEIQPGGLYQATVSVTIDDDADPDNDAWTMTFIWNAES
jgi:hypothetical protein